MDVKVEDGKNAYKQLKNVIEFQQEISVYICITKKSHIATYLVDSMDGIKEIITEDRLMLEKATYFYSVLKELLRNTILLSDEFQVIQDMLYEYQIYQSYLQVTIQELECERARTELNYDITVDSLASVVISENAFPWITLKERAHEIHDSVISQPLRLKIVTSPNTVISKVSNVAMHLKEFVVGKGWVTPQKHSTISWNPSFSTIDLENGDITIRIEVGKDYCFSSKLSIHYEVEMTVLRQSAMGNMFEYQITLPTKEVEGFYILSHQKTWLSTSTSVVHTLCDDHNIELKQIRPRKKRRESNIQKKEESPRYKVLVSEKTTNIVRLINGLQRIINNSLKKITNEPHRLLRDYEIQSIIEFVISFQSDTEKKAANPFEESITFQTVHELWTRVGVFIKDLVFTKKIEQMWVDGYIFGILTKKKIEEILSTRKPLTSILSCNLVPFREKENKNGFATYVFSTMLENNTFDHAIIEMEKTLVSEKNAFVLKIRNNNPNTRKMLVFNYKESIIKEVSIKEFYDTFLSIKEFDHSDIPDADYRYI